VQGTLNGVVLLGYGDYGEDVTRKDGSRVQYAVLHDQRTHETAKLTLDESFKPADGLRMYQEVEVDVVADLRQDAAIAKNGRAYARGVQVKLRVTAMRPAGSASNGKSRSREASAAAA